MTSECFLLENFDLKKIWIQVVIKHDDIIVLFFLKQRLGYLF